MNQASGGNGIPAEMFQILKDEGKSCTQYASKFGKLRSGHTTGKSQFSFQSQRRTMPKNVQTTTQLHSFHIPQQGSVQNCLSKASRVCEPLTSRCSSWFQKRQRNQRSNCQHPLDHQKSKRVPEKHHFCFIDCAKAFDCDCGKFFKRWEYQTTLLAS